jgi:hypothetical protein
MGAKRSRTLLRGARAFGRGTGDSWYPASFGVASTITDQLYSWTISGVQGRLFDVSRTGDRFLVMKTEERQPGENPPSSIVIVQNWQEELKQRVPVKQP